LLDTVCCWIIDKPWVV